MAPGIGGAELVQALMASRWKVEVDRGRNIGCDVERARGRQGLAGGGMGATWEGLDKVQQPHFAEIPERIYRRVLRTAASIQLRIQRKHARRPSLSAACAIATRGCLFNQDP